MRITIQNNELVKIASIREATRTMIRQILGLTQRSPGLNFLLKNALDHYRIIACPVCQGVACHTSTIESMPPYKVFECQQEHTTEIQQAFDEDE